MSNFCHDDYDHPLLWCDGKRRLVERQNAAQAQVLVRQQKEDERRQRIVEQREEFRSFSSVQNTGKIGRSSAQPLMRFHSVQPSAVPEHVNTNNATTVRRLSKSNLQNAWGRPGPGGTAWRSPKQIGKSFMKSMGWTDKHTLQQIDPYRSAADQQHQQHQQHHVNVDGDGRCGADGGVDGVSSPRRVQMPGAPVTATNAKPAPFLPPMKCCCSKCCCNCGMVFRDEHDVEKQSQQQQHQRPKPTAHPQRKGGRNSSGGGVELVPLLARRRAKQQTTALSTTDVTKIPNPSKFEEPGHLNDLCRQIRQKQRREQLQREQENVSSRRHFQTLDSLWGRPGHGAPRAIKNKLNLDAMLYKLPMQIVDKEL